MKKSIISLAIAAGLVASMPAAHAGDVKVKWFGFGQITAKQGDGLDPATTTDPQTGVKFGADRVRIGFKVKDGNVFGKLQVDFNKANSDKVSGTKIKAPEGTLPQIIKDIEVGYKFSKAASLKVGQFKTPVGMDFNVSGKKLDITQRGMEKGLVLERTAGIMLSGRKIANGFGYDLFYGNPAGRGKANVGGTTGVTNSYAARVMYDMGKMMHMELSYGVDETNDTTKDDYNVLDFGLKFKSGPSTVKVEYIAGSNVKGDKDVDETVWYLHYGHMLGKTTELVARHYQADIDIANTGSATLTNTYLGANFFLGSSKTNGRVQVYYVIAGGDNAVTGTGSKYWTAEAAGASAAISSGKSAYYDDVILAQYQVSF